MLTKEPAYELALVTGFLIVGPFLCLGLYDISRRLEQKEQVKLASTLVAWRRNAPAVGFFALILALLMAVWLRVSSVVVALFFPNGMPSLAEMIANVVTAPEGIVFVLAYVMAGAGFALLVFATTAVSIPMLLDREKMDALTAMIVSVNALRKNFRPMMLWALIIVVLMGAGFLAWFAGLSEVRNPTDQAVTADPEPSPGLVPLDTASAVVAAHGSAHHDYVVAVDRFGHTYPWPTDNALAAAGSFDQHFSHMRSFWNRQLLRTASLEVPDAALGNAYRSGYITTQIARSGTHLDTGVNGYESEFSHDVVGILATLFTEGDYSDAHGLLLEARSVVGSQGQYEDGTWTYAWPWAIYLMKTGDLGFVKANFATTGPAGTGQPSIEEAAHAIATDRTGPGGIMGMTNDIDSNGFWTIDDYEALMGLAAYRYLARRVGNRTELSWATTEYDALLAATNRTLRSTIARFHLTYLPCSILEPNTSNRCALAEDANWAAPFQFGKWAWDAPLFGAAVNGPGLTLIDSTYSYGFGRLKGTLPAGTFGGFPPDYYSSAYNTAYGSWGLASARHRDQGIVGYEFMINHDQSGPYSWWESSSAPSPSNPWRGDHPAAGQGSSPHAWGISEANKVLLDSLVAQKADGSLIVGRGVPDRWLRRPTPISVSNFPTVNNRRLGLRISSQGQSITLTMSGQAPSGPVLFQLPVFAGNIATTSTGRINRRAATVTLSSHTKSVTVRLRHLAGA